MSGDVSATSSSGSRPVSPTSPQLISLALPGYLAPSPLLSTYLTSTMSSIAAVAARRAFARPAALRIPQRRFLATSKLEEGGLDKAPKRDPELYVWRLVFQWILPECNYLIAFLRSSSVSCPAPSCSLDGKYCPSRIAAKIIDWSASVLETIADASNLFYLNLQVFWPQAHFRDFRRKQCSHWRERHALGA